MFEGLDRDDLIDGLRELIQRARDRGLGPVSIRIIGGAALRLAYFDRTTTVDIDATITPFDDLKPIVEQISHERGWPVNWLNDEAKRAGFVPTWGRQVEWVSLFDDGNAIVEVASPTALLAMKLRAFERRGRRDLNDVLQLLPLSGATSATEVEQLFEEYFPGDALKTTTIEFLDKVFAGGLPSAAPTPPIPKF
jgi:hypothetical protein